jgi:hypothetical protein
MLHTHATKHMQLRTSTDSHVGKKVVCAFTCADVYRLDVYRLRLYVCRCVPTPTSVDSAFLVFVLFSPNTTAHANADNRCQGNARILQSFSSHRSVQLVSFVNVIVPFVCACMDRCFDSTTFVLCGQAHLCREPIMLGIINWVLVLLFSARTVSSKGCERGVLRVGEVAVRTAGVVLCDVRAWSWCAVRCAVFSRSRVPGCSVW